jgi:hypothetical protein
MIAQATPVRPHTPPGSPALVGNKVPLPHRFHLTDGRTLCGDLHKARNARLADHLSTVKGFISVTSACCEATGRTFAHLVLNQDHILFVEEVHETRPPVVGGAAPAERPHVSR